ncbi:poly-gamma-glutamate system protein [Thalassoroseus pseudoceratinae]|uniref:poly-gamma-glutamate system protein n=1 Tax=Thalassoroseus pseudoceratinae TaxID=2713176 RepID=UPI001422E089|nr:poly-gamma-glutamate system protein [Thalassoroseus pseudoceratinae]
MQKSYWTHPKSSRTVVILTFLLAIGGVAAAEFLRNEPTATLQTQKTAAANLALEMMETVKAERERLGVPIDPKVDPAESGIIGLPSSIVTSNNGHLPAKQTSVNPNFAAVLVEMLSQAGVKSGDVVAVGLSGSFPAMNISTCAALETMKCKPILVASAAGSQWGANLPDLMWVNMEKRLHDEGLMSFRSKAVSLGGLDDQAADMTEEGVAAVREAIDRSGVPFLETHGYTDSLKKRLRLYQKHAGEEPIMAYINIGGGTVSVGTSASKNLFRAGVNTHLPSEMLPKDSVMSFFLNHDTPVIHLSHIETLATRYGLPLQPQVTPDPAGEVIEAPRSYNVWIAAGSLLLIFTAMYGQVVFQWSRNRTASKFARANTEEVHQAA